MKINKVKSTSRTPRKADRAFASQSIYEEVIRGMRDAGFGTAMEKLTITAARAETHDKILFGDGRDGLVSDVEALKMNTQATLTSINITLSSLKAKIEPLLEWKSNIVIKVAIIVAAASTVSAVLGAVLTMLVNWKWLFAAFLKAPQ